MVDAAARRLGVRKGTSDPEDIKKLCRAVAEDLDVRLADLAHAFFTTEIPDVPPVLGERRKVKGTFEDRAA